jgi:hypothetical protein
MPVRPLASHALGDARLLDGPFAILDLAFNDVALAGQSVCRFCAAGFDDWRPMRFPLIPCAFHACDFRDIEFRVPSAIVIADHFDCERRVACIDGLHPNTVGKDCECRSFHLGCLRKGLRLVRSSFYFDPAFLG